MPPSDLQLRNNFLKLSLADFIVRSAYQMGKTPLLPIFAAFLGAGETFLGVIVSVSTLTGMLSKPLIGFLSDSWGRRTWLLIGTLFFSLTPFLYWWVETPKELFWIRLVHGMATAIYGPVTLAFIAAQSKHRVAESLGWFSLAKEGGYIIGPATAGILLLYISPQWIFTLIGLLSCLAFLPVMTLSETKRDSFVKASLKQQLMSARQTLQQSTAIYLAGGLESFNYLVLYALKAFLPIYALTTGFNTAAVGAFFALQESTHMLLKPFMGRLADRLGYLAMMILGMVILGVSVFGVMHVTSLALLFVIALTSGIAQALIFPASLALVAQQVNVSQLGLSMGLVGAVRNAGKVLGPILAGILIQRFDYQLSFQLLGSCLLVFACGIGIHKLIAKKRFTAFAYHSSAD